MVNRDDIRRYDPVGVGYDGDPGKVYSVLVVDRAGGLPDVRVRCRIKEGEIKWMWDPRTSHGMMGDMELRDLVLCNPDVLRKANAAAVDHLSWMGLIVRDDNGLWRCSDPGIRALKGRVVSMCRRAKVSIGRGLTGLTGRVRA